MYYYGARYLDPKYSRWLSGDPALSDYIPKAPIDDEAKKHNENLPGMGGVFNVVNLHLYHYAGNNPVKYTDPTGRDIIHLLDPSAAGIFGHSAALIGNDQDGWLYYSNDGSTSTTVKWFQNLDAFSTGKGEFEFNYEQRQRVTTDKKQDQKMQDKAISLTNLTQDAAKTMKDEDLKVLQDTDNTKTKDGDTKLDRNVKGSTYNFLFNNCSEDVAKIAEAGDLIVKNELVPKAMHILTNEAFLPYSDELLW